MERTQLDVMRTVCYQPGPLQPADISDLLKPATATAKLEPLLASSPEGAAEVESSKIDSLNGQYDDTIIPVAPAVGVAA